MNFWRPRILIIGVALICAIAAVSRHFTAVETMRKSMSLQAKVLTAFDDSHTGMLSIDAGDNVQIIAQANEAACDIFGFPKGQLAGHEIGDILPAPFRALHAAKVLAALESAKSGRSHVGTMRCIGVRKDGTPADVYVRVFVTKNGVVALVSLSSETFFTTMGMDGTTTLPKPVAP